MGRKRVIMTKKQEKKLMKIDPSGRLVYGAYAAACLLLGLIMYPISDFFGIILIIPGCLLVIKIIFVTIMIDIKEKKKQQILLNEGISKIDRLTPIEFEDYVARIFRMKGYSAKTTIASNDYGIDVVLEKNTEKIGVQVKKYSNTVGIKAVQEVISGMKYYGCSKGMVVTNAKDYTRQARNLAESCNIKLIAYDGLVNIILELQKEHKDIEDECNENN